MASSFGMFAVLIALMSGGPNDLLDVIPTDAYWKAKGGEPAAAALLAELAVPTGQDISAHLRSLGAENHAERQKATAAILAQGPAAIPQLEKAADDPDPEVANRIRSIINQLKVANKAAAVRKLMAIRTLGERKAVDALPTLRGQLESKDMFVAEYARRAIAAAEGKPYVANPALAKEIADGMKADLALLPANCGVVGQAVVGLSGKPFSLEKAMNDVPIPIPAEEKQRVLDQVVQALIKTADQVGNVRVDGATLGVADAIGPNNGFVVVIARGQYDAQAAANYLRKEMGERARSETVDGLELFKPDREVGFGFVANDRAVLLAAPAAEKMPSKEMAAALRQNKGTLMTNADMARLIASVDPGAKVWAVAKISESYRQAEVINAFDTIKLVGLQEGEMMNFKVSAAGSDAAKTQAAVNTVNTGINRAKTEIAQAVKMMPALKPVADLMETVKCEQDAGNGANATLSGSLKGDAGALMMFPALFFGAVRAHEAPAVEQAPPVVEPARPEPGRK